MWRILMITIFGLCSVSMCACCNGSKSVKAEGYAFYKAVRFGTEEDMEKLLEAGHDPNYMNASGADIWQQTNPLWVLTFYYTRTELLLRYGASVSDRPYIAKVLFDPFLSSTLADEMKNNYFHDARTDSEETAFKIISLYLQKGADPNLKYCLSPRLNPNTALEYYKENGISAINCAIRLNLFSIVDLLLNNGAVLDDRALEFAKIATERSGGNTQMETKIRALFEKQN